MRRLIVGLALVGLLVGGLPMIAEEAEAAPQTQTMRFGMEAGSVGPQTAHGVKPDYGTMWVGPWTLKSGWSGPGAQMSQMREQGVTPAIHLYYWGDDITRQCLEKGCWSDLHGVHKNKKDWQVLTGQLVREMERRMGGEPVVVFLETEFNKANVQTYEPLDGWLEEKAKFIKRAYPNAQVVLALGTWNTGAWKTWDRAAAASDYIGIQAMRGSTQDSLSSYQNMYEATLHGARVAKQTFGKPVFITDVALSSHPEPAYAKHQADALAKFFRGMPALKAAGVEAMVYRSWWDTPNMDLKNYYGVAERHWGLASTPSGKLKPAGEVWVNGVKAERGSFEASFLPSHHISASWVEVTVTSKERVAMVYASIHGGAWRSLDRTDWGTWGRSLDVPAGATIVFRAVDADGRHVNSAPVRTLSASFAVTGNEWWVQTTPHANQPLSMVEVRVDGGPWMRLDRHDGFWARHTHVPDGSEVQFRAISQQHGFRVTSPVHTW